MCEFNHKDDASDWLLGGEEWSIEGELREPTAQENLIFYHLLVDSENRLN